MMYGQQAHAESDKYHLCQEKAQVEKELAFLQQALQTEINVEADAGDAEIFTRMLNSTLIQILEHRLRELKAALQAVEQGFYGICERCRQPIERERLAVKPEAIRCLVCQKALECSPHGHSSPLGQRRKSRERE